MTYLDYTRLNKIDPKMFRAQEPFPWLNPDGLLTDEGYQRLRETLPDIALFERRFDAPRKYGQKCHDRYTLVWSTDPPVPSPWKEFIAELEGRDYRTFWESLLETSAFSLNYHWHYTPNGCSVSPHCDAKRKLGSHIFYFNTKDDWDPSWGGTTVILDDHGRFHSDSAPNFEDFDHVIESQALGNYSLLFTRKGNSWHGVREIHCPEGALRKVFIVEIIHQSLASRVRYSLFGQHAAGY